MRLLARAAVLASWGISLFAPPVLSWHSYSTATFNGSGGAGDSLSKIARDSSGNIWAVGYISTATGASVDAWIGKFNSSLAIQSSATFNGPSDKQDTASDIAFDSSGNVYVVGFTSQTNTGFDVWLAKYNSSLAVVSSITVSGPSGASHYDYGQAIAVGSDGSVYVGGTIDTTTASSAAAGDTGNDGWLAKYDSNLLFVSSYVFRGLTNGFDRVFDVVLDGDNNVYATGYVWDAHSPPGNNSDIWLAKFNSSLVLIASRSINGPGNYDDYGYAVTLDASSNVYVTGLERMNSGVDDIWVGKFDNSLNLLSSATFNGPGDSVDTGWGVAVDAAGSVYVSGTIYDSSQNYDMWFGKFSSSTVLRSSFSYNGPGNNYDTTVNLILDQSGNAYAGGTIYTSTQGSSADIWLAKFNMTLAAAPAFSTASALGASSITWVWSNQNIHEDAFRVVDLSSNNLSGAVTSYSWTETALSTNTSYSRQLTAYNAFGAATSTVISLYTLAAPPTGLTVLSLNQSSITLQWSANTNPAGTNYRLDYWTAGGATSSIAASVTTASLTGLSEGTNYFIRVAAINAVGLTSWSSDLLSTTTATGLIAPSLATPVFSNVGTSSFTVAWTSGSISSGYNGTSTGYIVKIVSSSSESAAFTSSATTALSAYISGLSPNVTYYAWAAAYAQGSTTSFTALGSTVTSAAAPASVVASSVSYFALEITWNQNSNLNGTIFDAQLSSADFPNSYSANQSSQTVLTMAGFYGLSYGTTYYIRVRAINWLGVSSEFSSSISTVTLGLPVSPASLTGSALGVSSVSWTWAHAGARDGYRIISSTGGNLSGDLSSATTTWTDIGLSTNTLYSRQAVAFNSVGAATSSAVSVYTLAATPAQVAPLAVYLSSMTIEWSAEGNPSGTTYYVENWTLGGSTSTTSVTVTSTVLTGLSASTTYYLRLRARNGDGVYTGGVSLSTVTQSAAVSSQTVTNESATVTFTPAPGEVRLEIPAGTFSESVSLLLQTPSSVPSVASQSSDFSATGVAVDITNDRSLQPLKEVTLTMSYRDADVSGLDESRLIVSRYDSDKSVWVPLVSETDAANNKVTARTNHFSVFQIMQVAVANALNTARVFPNPFRPARGHSAITLSNLPASATIKIYTMSGQLVRELSANSAGMASWDGRTSSGENSSSGVYFVLLSSGGEKRTLKLAVER